MKKLVVVGVSASLLVLAFALGYFAASGMLNSPAAELSFAHPALAKEQPSLAASDPSPLGAYTFRDVAKQVSPCVVGITARTAVKVPQFDFPFWFFEDPFGMQGPKRRAPEQEEKELWKKAGGTGFIIDASGLILTNNHVVQDADEIDVKLLDEREFPAKVVGRDPETDVALVRIETGGDLPVARLGDSSALEVGDWVVAIGNPYGLDHTVTVGVVSAKERRVGLGNYDRFIQTDAAINVGNSGGPLVNISGEVVGINAAIIGLRAGIGLAVPINVAKAILPDLRDKGKVRRAWLGVSIQPVSPDFQESLGLKDRQGAIVSEVIKGSPAEQAGLQIGDLILEFDGKAVQSSWELPEMVGLEPIGKDAKLLILRDGKKVQMHLKLGEKPSSEAPPEEKAESRSELGLQVQDITPDVARRYRLPEDIGGVVVTDVKFKSPAEKAEIKQGDVIMKIGWTPIKNAEHFYEVSSKLGTGVQMLLIYRDGGQFFVPVRIKAEE